MKRSNNKLFTYETDHPKNYNEFREMLHKYFYPGN